MFELTLPLPGRFVLSPFAAGIYIFSTNKYTQKDVIVILHYPTQVGKTKIIVWLLHGLTSLKIQVSIYRLPTSLS